MGIFGKGSTSSSSIDSSSGSTSTRNRRNSSNTVTSSVPVSIVPAPPQVGHPGAFLKPNPTSAAAITSSSVFGRQQSWSDKLADATLLKTNSSYPPAVVIPVSHNQNILYPNNNTVNTSNTTTSNSNSNDVKFVHSTMEILENQIKREEAPKKKRTRTSTEQLRILQKAFQTDPMPNSSARAALSKKLGMSTRAVQVWFQNRRAKEKLDAKRNMLGLSGTSSFTYLKGNNSDDEEGVANEDDDEFNYEEEDSVSNETGGKSGEFLNSMKANGMMGRMAFTSSSNENNPIKAQRSSSTPNGFFQGFPNSSISNQQGRGFNQMSKPPVYNNNLAANNPLCHLFPGETFISDVNEASVDQLYQDLGGVGASSVHSPIDDTCAVNSTGPVASSSAGNFFTFGDPFYGGGIIDRTPSVSPVGFGPRSHFYHPIGNSNFDFMLPNSNITNMTNVTSEFNSSPSLDSTSTFPPASACKGISGGNVYLTSSITGANRRSFSLPEAHGNLTFQQMQQLENFGLQVFPSPLLSINEEESSKIKNEPDNNNNIQDNNTIINSSPKATTASTNSNDFLIPFSDFLEGEVIR